MTQNGHTYVGSARRAASLLRDTRLMHPNFREDTKGKGGGMKSLMWLELLASLEEMQSDSHFQRPV